MTRVVLNLCGVKSKGGITVLKNYLSQNKDKTFYVLYDNLDFEQYIKNFDIEFVDVKRRYHPILNLILQKEIIKKINTFDYVIDCLVSLCDHDPLQAEQCVLLTHHIGYCEILTGDQQYLELIEKDLALYGLTVNIV